MSSLIYGQTMFFCSSCQTNQLFFRPQILDQWCYYELNWWICISLTSKMGRCKFWTFPFPSKIGQETLKIEVSFKAKFRNSKNTNRFKSGQKWLKKSCFSYQKSAYIPYSPWRECHGLRQRLTWLNLFKCGLVLCLNLFVLLPQLSQKMMLNSKVTQK